VSSETQRLIDQEIRRIVEESHQAVNALLRAERDKLDALATALLEHETLDEADAYAAAGVERTSRRQLAPPAAAAVSAAPADA
jgi:cell division protease FtsH